jgi:HlyD family secretion protein/adhesin transport system membrane fusion protein
MHSSIEEGGWNYRVSIYPIMLFLVLFIAWIYSYSIDEMVIGSGRVIPSSNSKIIQHLEGGIVEKIYVKEGDRVKKGAPLFKVKNSFYTSDTQQKKIELENLNREIVRLSSLINLKKEIKFQTQHPLNRVERDIFNSQMKHFLEKQSLYQGELDKLRLEKKQKNGKIDNLNLELKIVKEQLFITNKLLKKVAASKQQYLNELAKQQSLITQIGTLKNDIPIINQQIKSAMTKMTTFKSEMKSKWLEELNECKIKAIKLKENQIASIDRESRQLITSPVNGVIKKLNFNTLGGIIKSGDNIVEITPLDDTLIIEAKIKSNDRGDLIVGQDVSIEISAYSYSKYGFLKGKLIFISPDSFTDSDNSSHYIVKVEAKNHKVAEGKEIIPGMVATIHIKTGKKTILTYILKPLKDISHNALIEK